MRKYEMLLNFVKNMKKNKYDIQLQETEESINVNISNEQLYKFYFDGKVVVDAFGRKALNVFNSWEEFYYNTFFQKVNKYLIKFYLRLSKKKKETKQSLY